MQDFDESCEGVTSDIRSLYNAAIEDKTEGEQEPLTSTAVRGRNYAVI